MSQYVDWTATPVSMWIYGNVWECEWKWCVDKVVVISVSIIRLVHTQMILVAAPASDRYRRDSLRRMCFVACLSRKKKLSRQKWYLYSSPQWNLSCPFICKAWKGCHRRLTVLLSVCTESWRFTVRTCNCLTMGISSCVFLFFFFFFLFLFSFFFLRNMKHSFTRWLRQNWHNSCFLYRVTHWDPLCKLCLTTISHVM